MCKFEIHSQNESFLPSTKKKKRTASWTAPPAPTAPPRPVVAPRRRGSLPKPPATLHLAGRGSVLAPNPILVMWLLRWKKGRCR